MILRGVRDSEKKVTWEARNLSAKTIEQKNGVLAMVLEAQ